MAKPHTPKMSYAAQFRQQMVDIEQARRTPNGLAREFGCDVTSILSWVRKARLGLPAGSVALELPLGTSERHELLDLRRKVRHLQMERDSYCVAVWDFSDLPQM